MNRRTAQPARFTTAAIAPIQRPIAGFTLIELLVVVAIIAALLAVLLPSLAGARRTVQRVECLTRLREVGGAWHRFALDWADAVPHGGVTYTVDGDWYDLDDPSTQDLWRGDAVPSEWVAMGLLVGETLDDELHLHCPGAETRWTDTWNQVQLAGPEPLLAGSFEVGGVGLDGMRAMTPYAQRGMSRGAPTKVGQGPRVAILADLHHRDASGFEFLNHPGGLNALYTDGAAGFISGPDSADFDPIADFNAGDTDKPTWRELDRGRLDAGP